jgi:hypothetical protein
VRTTFVRRSKESGVVAFKWTGILIAVVSVALDGLANLLLATMTKDEVPDVINGAATGLAVIGVLGAFICHVYERFECRLERVVAAFIERIDELESRVGDRNSGFAEGYMLSQSTPEAPVIPLAPRGLARRVVTSMDD